MKGLVIMRFVLGKPRPVWTDPLQRPGVFQYSWGTGGCYGGKKNYVERMRVSGRVFLQRKKTGQGVWNLSFPGTFRTVNLEVKISILWLWFPSFSRTGFRFKGEGRGQMYCIRTWSVRLEIPELRLLPIEPKKPKKNRD